MNIQDRLAPVQAPPPPAGPAPRVSRRGLYIPLALFGIAVAVWSGFWFFAKSKTTELMDAWMAREARLGRQWTCPDRAVGGFPFRIDVSCVNPTFVSNQAGRAGQGSLAGLAVTARAVDPKQIIAAIQGPLKFAAESGETVEISFNGARASYRGTPNQIDQISLDLDAPSATVTVPGIQPQTIAAGKTEFHLRRAPGAEPATDLVLTASGIKSGLINAILQDPSDGSLDIRGQLTRFAPAPPKDWRETLEGWRRAEGEARFERLNLSKGPIVLNLTGNLRLDDQRRPEGEIAGTAQGAQQLLRAFGVDLGGGAGGLLGAILGGGNPRANAPAKALPFNVRMDQGRLFIGPIPGPRLRPLYGYAN
jgi:hypothetical protein